MGVWSFVGGSKWNGANFVPNTRTNYVVENEEDKTFQLDEGDLITSGLIDMHCHVWAMNVDRTMAVSDQMFTATGVIACVDGGSFGYKEWPHADRFWRATGLVEMRSFLNIRPEALNTWPCTNPTLPSDISVDDLVETYKKSNGRIFGFKAHLGWGKDADTDRGWLKIAREAADKAGTKVGVHITNSYLTIEEILSYLKPGDIVIHVYQGKGCAPLDADGTYSQALIDAQKRGIIMDGAVGMNHLSWNVFKQAMAKGFKADVITTDMVNLAWQNKPYRDFPHVISAFIAGGGMDLDDVFKAVTTTPAKIMGTKYDLDANLLVLKKKDGPVQFSDSLGEYVEGDFEYVTSVFLKEGKVVIDRL
jgi:dihydroorotase